VVVRGEGSRNPGSAVARAVDVYACTTREERSDLRVVACTNCGLRALDQALPAADVEAAYAAVEDPHYLTIEPHREVAFDKLIRRVGKWRQPPGRLLDVGCYTGLFLKAALAAGWDAFGIEPSRWAARTAAERLPGRVTPGFLRGAHFPPASFDVVTAWDVVEHLTDPREDLTRMARLLRPGGWLFLSTMASEALIARLLGRRWPWYMDMHRYYFTPRTLEMLLAQTGFTLRVVESYPHYTSLRYIVWKLELTLGPFARGAAGIARALGIADRTIPIDVGDFFLAVAQRMNRSL
jgi:SAM-dependent methyltransferase